MDCKKEKIWREEGLMHEGREGRGRVSFAFIVKPLMRIVEEWLKVPPLDYRIDAKRFLR